MKHLFNKNILMTSCLSIFSLSNYFRAHADNQYNVLFLMVDDLRPELGCYGKSYIKTPNIDRLAKNGIVMDRAYCNIPVSGSTRCSLLTGLYPNRTRFTTSYAKAIDEVPDIVSMPEHFKNNGFETVSLGKVFHHHSTDMLRAWSVKPWHPSQGQYWRDYRSPENKVAQENKKGGPAWEKAAVEDNGYYDGKTAEKAVEQLKIFAKNKKRFFLGVGFLKPHLPFNAPQKYWDMYSREDISLAPNPFYPEGAPDDATSYNYDELRGYDDIPKGRISINDETAYNLKHGYFACVSYVDAQIGRVLQTLHETGLDKNTIIVLLGDHGWTLGEHSHWCKHTCFHNNLNVPLIFSVPGLKKNVKSEALVSYIDLYPTLCELNGLEKPVHLQGESIVDILENPGKKGGYEFCRYPDGETIVTERYVYTEYYDKKTKQYSSRMLYDHSNDPMENVNVSEKSEYKDVVSKLSELLHEHINKINN